MPKRPREGYEQNAAIKAIEAAYHDGKITDEAVCMALKFMGMPLPKDVNKQSERPHKELFLEAQDKDDPIITVKVRDDLIITVKVCKELFFQAQKKDDPKKTVTLWYDFSDEVAQQLGEWDDEMTMLLGWACGVTIRYHRVCFAKSP